MPLVCVPGAIPAARRDEHVERTGRLFTALLRARRSRQNGYSYRFDAETLDDVTRWIALERQCCPFLRFTLRLEPNDGPMTLDVTGPAGTPAFLDAELPVAGGES